MIAMRTVTFIGINHQKYKAGAYYQITKIPLLYLRRDLGKYGEYLTYKQLRQFEKDGAKFLFNVYIPKGNGRRHKEHFYNPIMQNHSHIKHLQALFEEPIPMHSIIVFSERCTLKNITIKSDFK